MRIIARRTLRRFVDSLAGHKDQPAVKAALDAWFDEARKAHWTGTADVKRCYATASIVTSERVVSVDREAGAGNRPVPAKRPWQRAGAKLCKAKPKPELS